MTNGSSRKTSAAIATGRRTARFLATSATLFPEARGGGSRLREATVLEFGGAEHAIFLTTLPLEFDDRVRLEAVEQGRPAEATVVAVQYHEGRKAVAVRFLQGHSNWVTQP